MARFPQRITNCFVSYSPTMSLKDVRSQLRAHQPLERRMFFSRRETEDRSEFEAEARHILLGRMVAAYSGDDREEADRALGQAVRWLTNHPNDDAILEARNQLRAKFKPLQHGRTVA